jgi:hypothetical protein
MTTKVLFHLVNFGKHEEIGQNLWDISKGYSVKPVLRGHL